MPKRFKNRKAEEFKKFLEANGYKFVSRHGDDVIYARDDCTYTVKLPDRNESLKNGTADYIKRMIGLCGIDRKDILKWWKDHGFGD